MEGAAIVSRKEEINQLWGEVFKIREETGVCQDSSQKKRALFLMRELLRTGSEEDKKWVREKFVKIRWRLFKVDWQEGKRDASRNQLHKAQAILKNHPEIDQTLKRWVEADLAKITR